MGAAACNELIAQRTQRGGSGIDRLAALPNGLADGGKVAHGDRHDKSSEKAMNRTVSPDAIVWPAGLSTTPSPQAAEVSTPELWL